MPSACSIECSLWNCLVIYRCDTETLIEFVVGGMYLYSEFLNFKNHFTSRIKWKFMNRFASIEKERKKSKPFKMLMFMSKSTYFEGFELIRSTNSANGNVFAMRTTKGYNGLKFLLLSVAFLFNYSIQKCNTLKWFSFFNFCPLHASCLFLIMGFV